MTPQQIKARELVDKFTYQICNDNGLSENDSVTTCAKQCAIIACEEMESILFKADEDADVMFPTEIAFIRQVIQEINIL